MLLSLNCVFLLKALMTEKSEINPELGQLYNADSAYTLLRSFNTCGSGCIRFSTFWLDIFYKSRYFPSSVLNESSKETI